MLRKSRLRRILTSGTLFFVVVVPTSYAQDTAPLFSTPAGRSTTGAPILINPENQGNGAVQRFLNDRAQSQRPSDPVASNRQKRENASQPQDVVNNSSKTFDDWELQCIDHPKGDRRCQIVGNVLSADKKQAVLVMSLAPSADAATILIQMAVPLGVAVQQGVKIEIDKSYSGSMPISRCTSQGCLVEGAVPTEMIAAMIAKPKASIEVTTPDGKSVPISLSLKGFGGAYEAVTDRGKSSP
ncbi:invasion associated locus B family protein [Rhizobium sp. LjRoot98]|uniref:invasion associated locus B family protein n=1 Tax=Rhizobium sp. LjRoot98 TaxID=3342345 RepID=UPI003ED09624